MCGADNLRSPVSRFHVGSSPRVRSRQAAHVDPSSGTGIISACAEQTTFWRCSRTSSRDHLRVCGADHCSNSITELALGSSPRVRSRQSSGHPFPLHGGIISACAEQTLTSRLASLPAGDHLRVCGADIGIRDTGAFLKGSSPRVRSRLREDYLPCEVFRDHLRVCGADASPIMVSVISWGSSPRVRSRPIADIDFVSIRGIISACAEQTVSSFAEHVPVGDHLRVCGADFQTKFLQVPPGGIISACAEQTPPSWGASKIR